MTQQIPYGLWPSPISALGISQRIRLEDVQWDSDGQTLVWLEGRSGRGVLCSQSGAEARRDLTDELSVRGGVGYGGGEFCVQNGRIIFVEAGGRLFSHSLGYGKPRPITPPFGSAASPAISPDGRWVAYVFSDGTTDLLALVDVEGREWPVQLVKGADFYMQPAWHPAGDRLAWVEWNHPNMSWDGSRLMLGRVSGESPRVLDDICLDGGDEISAVQPQFSPDGRWISFIVSSGEWEDLMLVNLESGDRQTLLHGEGFHLAEPAWVQGRRTYGWCPQSDALYSIRNYAGRCELWKISLDGNSQKADLGPYTLLEQLSVSPAGDEVACLASGASVSARIIRWDGRQVRVAARSESELIAPDFMPLPQALQWAAPDGSPVHGIFWAPRNPGCQSSGLPPAIVYIHGGPTSEVPAAYSAQRAYFTSRGYGWLDVNYRGSSGYGRSYRNALRENWGLADVEDAAEGAAALEAQGLADGKRLIIYGGSAGGYTVLNALIRYPGRFKAGVCNYGVSNLYDIVRDTHKFELHYTDRLIGVLPEAARRFYDWSPVFHVDKIRDPLAVFQGSADKVVPPSQSEQIVAALRQNGVMHIYQVYEGEGHGFRKNETWVDYYPRVERFLQQQVIFSA